MFLTIFGTLWLEGWIWLADRQHWLPFLLVAFPVQAIPKRPRSAAAGAYSTSSTSGRVGPLGAGLILWTSAGYALMPKQPTIARFDGHR
jgi:hypothetical protein